MKIVRYHEAAETELFERRRLPRAPEERPRKAVSRGNQKSRVFDGAIARVFRRNSAGHPKALIRKFRYALIYSAVNDELVILAVARASRRPGYWVDRVSTEHT